MGIALNGGLRGYLSIDVSLSSLEQPRVSVSNDRATGVWGVYAGDARTALPCDPELSGGTPFSCLGLPWDPSECKSAADCC